MDPKSPPTDQITPRIQQNAARARERADLLARLKQQHGDDLHVLNEPYDVIGKAPPRAEWRRYVKMASEPDKKDRALDTLSRACIVWVPGATSTSTEDVLAAWDALLDRRAGMAESCGSRLRDIAMGEENADAKKL